MEQLQDHLGELKALIDSGLFISRKMGDKNLYELLDNGLYELEIGQFRYHIDTLEPVSSVLQQQLYVEVKKYYETTCHSGRLFFMVY